LGQAVKTMTGSKTFVTILNKFGQCVNYWKVEEIEMKMAKKACKPPLLQGLEPRADLTTMMPFDNYDEFTETLSGKNTLHETMGICIQSSPENKGKRNF